jgi:hypothetical protein
LKIPARWFVGSNPAPSANLIDSTPSFLFLFLLSKEEKELLLNKREDLFKKGKEVEGEKRASNNNKRVYR